MARGLEICAAVLLFFAGLLTLLYPTLNGARLENASQEAAESFIDAFVVPVERPEETPRPYGELYAAMEEYNEKIYAEKQRGLSDPRAYEAAGIDLSAYGLEDGIIAVLSVPAMELEMPVYLGASYETWRLEPLCWGRPACPSAGATPTVSSPGTGAGTARRIS